VMITFAVAVLLNSAVLAVQTNYTGGYKNDTGIAFDSNLNCTTCIRAGFDYCIYATDYNPQNVTKYGCVHSMLPGEPEYIPPQGGSNPSGYVCSYAMYDQTAAIVNGCRPYKHQTDPTWLEGQCGEYMVDLSDGLDFQTRNIQHLALHTSCTYRVYSDCGYPVAAFSIGNEWNSGDYDIAYSAVNMNSDKDFYTDYFLNSTTDWSGSYLSSTFTAETQISQGFSQPPLTNATVLQTCNDKPRNLYVTITRTKVTPPPKASEFLNERKLQALNYDFSLAFYSSLGGNAKVLGAISLAFAAMISVFAF